MCALFGQQHSKPDDKSLTHATAHSHQTQERRKRRGGPLRLAGLCLPPKALAPLVPLYLQVRCVAAFM